MRSSSILFILCHHNIKNSTHYNFGRLIKHIWNVLLLKTGQRISVWEYILAHSILWLFFVIFSILVWDTAITSFVQLIVYWYSFILLTKRLQDQWKKRTHILYILIPIYNIIRGIGATFSKWTKWVNAYGPDPLERQPESNRLYFLFWLLCFWLSILVSISIVLVMISYSGTRSDAIQDPSLYTTGDARADLRADLNSNLSSYYTDKIEK